MDKCSIPAAPTSNLVFPFMNRIPAKVAFRVPEFPTTERRLLIHLKRRRWRFEHLRPEKSL